MTLTFRTVTSIAAGESMLFLVNNVENPPTTEPTTTFSFAARNTANFLINSFSQSVTIATTEAATITSKSLLQQTSEAGAITSFSIDFTLLHDVPSTGVILVTYPNELELMKTGDTLFDC